MAYIEIRPAEDAFRLVIPGRDDSPHISHEGLIEPILASLGVTARGPWELVTDDSGEYRRALIL